MPQKCARCGSFHINRKVKDNHATTPLAILIAGVLVVIIINAMGLNFVAGMILLVVFGIIALPVLMIASSLIASALTGEGKTFTATCHKCGLSWDEKRAGITPTPTRQHR